MNTTKATPQCSRLYPLSILSRKWSYLLLRALQQPKGFSELQHDLRFITNHILSRELRTLEEEHLIEKKTQYRLTTAGKALLDAVEPLAQWSCQYAQSPECPKEKECAKCSMYAQTLGVRTFATMGREQK